MTTPTAITAADITKLRERHSAAVRRQSEVVGRRNALAAQQETLAKRMQEEWGVSSLDELRALLVSERAALEAAMVDAERLVAAAEAATK